jgi:hypothetical protein
MSTLKQSANKSLPDSTTNDFNSPVGAEIKTSDFRTLVNGDQDSFIYGLRKYENSKYEDPTFLGYTIELDQKSALFTDCLPFLQQQADKNLLEFKSRIPIYHQFVEKVNQIFNSQESATDEKQKQLFIKQHYINSVSGLNNLTKKFAEWRKDYLTIQLYEDIAMSTTYLSTLYNNLIYSYDDGRLMIPENLLYFNMNIRISEVRHFTSIMDPELRNNLKYNITCLEYKLNDAMFDFFETQPIAETITQSGIDAPTVPEAMSSLKIAYKNVSRQIYTPLIANSISMDDKRAGLDIIFVDNNGQETPTSLYRQESFLNKSHKPSSLKSYDSEVDRGATQTTNDLKEAEKVLNQIKEYNEKRDPLVNKPKDVVSPAEVKSFKDKAKDKGNEVLSNAKKYANLRAKRVAYQGLAKVELAKEVGLQKVEAQLKLKRDEILKKIKDLILDTVLPNRENIEEKILDPLGNLYDLKIVNTDTLTDDDNVYY